MNITLGKAPLPLIENWMTQYITDVMYDYIANDCFRFVRLTDDEDYGIRLVSSDGCPTVSLQYVAVSVNDLHLFHGKVWWRDYTIGETIQFPKGGGSCILFRAKSITSTLAFGNGAKHMKFEIVSDDAQPNVFIYGNLNTLIKRDGQIDSVPDYAFQGLFENFTGTIVDAQYVTLPSMTVGNSSYLNMFKNTRISTAPALPATTLGSCCYLGMFLNCTALTNAPALPATTLADGCYSFMFSDCSSLWDVPELPVASLNDYCYECMFLNCTNISQFNGLSTIVEFGLYSCSLMFSGCRSLLTPDNAIVLNVTETELANVMSIFADTDVTKIDFTKLNYNTVALNFTNIMGDASYHSDGHSVECKCTDGIATFTVDNNTWTSAFIPYLEPLCFTATALNSSVKYSDSNASLQYSIVRSDNSTLDWTTYNGETIQLNELDKAYFRASLTGNTKCLGPFIMTGSIQATGNVMSLLSSMGTSESLENCQANTFSGLFADCSSLVSVPSLPATTLTTGCYSYMFSGCSELTSTGDLPASVMTDNCYDHMFYNCTKITSMPELSSTTLAFGCYQSMFEGCELLTMTYTLPATELVNSCYSSMFKNCIAMQSAPTMHILTVAKECCYSMFENCISLTYVDYTSLEAYDLADYCYSRMFYNCTQLTSTPSIYATTTGSSYECFESMFALTGLNSSYLNVSSYTAGTYAYEKMYTNTNLTSFSFMNGDITKNDISSIVYDDRIFGVAPVGITRTIEVYGAGESFTYTD